MPAWPLSPTAESVDDRILHAIADGQSWAEDDWDEVVARTGELVDTPRFKTLHVAFTHALEQRGRLGRLELLLIQQKVDPAGYRSPWDIDPRDVEGYDDPVAAAVERAQMRVDQIEPDMLREEGAQLLGELAYLLTDDE